MTLVLWLVLALVVTVASPFAVNRGAKALHTHKHARCLANTERLEVELGIRPAPPRLWSSREVETRWKDAIARGGLEGWKSATEAKAANFAEGQRDTSLVGCVSVFEVRRAFDDGAIDRTQAVTLLLHMGYGEKDALLLIPKPHPPRPRANHEPVDREQ